PEATGECAAGEKGEIVQRLPGSTTAEPDAGAQGRRHPHHIQYGRRGILLGTGAAIAGAALGSPSVASADNGDGEDLFRPQPLPQPRPIPGTFAPDAPIHVFSPGPANITLPLSHGTLQGLDVDPAVITDYSGFTALVYPVGT